MLPCCDKVPVSWNRYKVTLWYSYEKQSQLRFEVTCDKITVTRESQLWDFTSYFDI